MKNFLYKNSKFIALALIFAVWLSLLVLMGKVKLPPGDNVAELLMYVAIIGQIGAVFLIAIFGFGGESMPKKDELDPEILKDNIKEREDEIASLKDELSDAKTKLADTDSELRNEISRLAEELETSQENVSRLTAELETSKENARRLSGELETSKENVSRLTEEIETSKENVSRLTGELETSEENVSRLTEELETAKENVSRLTGELETSEENVRRLTGELETARAEAADLKADGERVQELEEKYNKLIAEHDEQSGELQRQHAELMDKDKSLEERNEQIRALADEKNQLEESLKQINLKAEEKTESSSRIDHSLIENIKKETDDISNAASETSRLSLEAAMRSAALGEEGKAFADVAKEVLTFGKSVGKSAKSIRELCSQIQQRGMKNPAAS